VRTGQEALELQKFYEHREAKKEHFKQLHLKIQEKNRTVLNFLLVAGLYFFLM
jgi:hypothetical protein